MTAMIRILVIGTLLAGLAATPADARRFRFGFGGSGRGEQIERVADLPDRDPYRHDNVDWDLGWFYSSYKVAGITTSSSYDHGKFVLYHGDRYVILDDAKLALITLELGYDPAKAFREAHAAEWAADAAKAKAEAESLKDNLIERRPGESIDAYHARARAEARNRSGDGAAASAAPARSGAGGAIGSAFVGILFMLAVIVWLGRTLSRRQRRAALARGAEGRCDPAAPSFEERVAARLRELDATQAAPAAAAAPVTAAAEPNVAMAAPAVAPPPVPPVQRPGVRTFGRRVTA